MRVVVTGRGARSTVGAGVAALWEGVCAARAGTGAVEGFGSGDGAAIARAAIDEAIAEAGVEVSDTCVVWGTGLDTYVDGAEGIVRKPAGEAFGEIAGRHRAPRRMIAVACATGTQAIGHAAQLVRSGRVALAVAGGSSVMRSPYYATGFSALGALAPQRCRPFDAERNGFMLADGAGAVVIESLAHAEARGATPLAELLGFGASQDAFDLHRPPEDGAGAALCIERALNDAKITAADVDTFNAHGTGTIAGDIAEAAAIRRVLGERWREVPVCSVKGAIGHAQAAAGALEALVAIETVRTGVVPPTCHLATPDERCALDHVIVRPRDAGARVAVSTSFGMGGQNAAVIVRRP